MPDRLSALDASFLYLEDSTTPMHVGGVAILRRPRSGLDYERVLALIEQRLPLVPRYRQRVVHVPGRLARPVWVDDPDFDLTYHVRRSALPRPGSDAQLHELVARLMSRPLDHSRPLWEIYLVEGLARQHVAVVTKTHHAMVDGISAIDIGQVILDVSATPRAVPEELWMPEPAPGPLQLVLDAAAEAVRSPGAVIDNVRSAAMDAAATARKVADAVGGLASALSAAARPAPVSPLNIRISPQRRYAVARTALEDYRRVRSAHGGTVNDVVLAVVAGALRNWLLSRGEVVTSSTTMRALVPVSVRDPEADPATVPTVGNKVSAYLVDLPVGEPNPVVRLHHVSHAMRAHKESGQSVAAGALVRLSGLAPPTLHALGARVASSFSRRIFNLVVTNVPGPQVPLYVAGARMVEMFPVVPLAKGQALSVGVTSYDGGVYFGLNADRDGMSDVDVLAAMVEESLEELMGTVSA
ncbi:acyltransferase, WS/DGAT/MGAT [Streptoalloteichus tenebrarius]|uniref:Diacylglycerol O-acyltransferase n=1 Tax=Streptoalloteichus tenebrarius (strain ATCC 17920 / DSM 40477 / JCM 4838 / CBS 697.72 / NBRC 16177 / NCIMB 11028 / NRRL B-12390 / A12253. 1 / ISP 5477) TaxID=1933 RepID=A0ABT1HT61_STRSD|nr:wax ester/triacylglycerol synthase family O-acyltransferase [Streptoalloteichus tenebrarius]MCP2258694.1 acyltransferase, WS/DGAT/MGAT [Streptoalloteichus tenebrarius]BFF02840.1 wax ester/triacylglycerol synthase family O-acyltransferase [Streptoalloteichus tenebrarius]